MAVRRSPLRSFRNAAPGLPTPWASFLVKRGGEGTGALQESFFLLEFPDSVKNVSGGPSLIKNLRAGVSPGGSDKVEGAVAEPGSSQWLTGTQRLLLRGRGKFQRWCGALRTGSPVSATGPGWHPHAGQGWLGGCCENLSQHGSRELSSRTQQIVCLARGLGPRQNLLLNSVSRKADLPNSKVLKREPNRWW